MPNSQLATLKRLKLVFMSISLFLLLGCEKDENNVPKNSKAISIEHITLSSISENKIVYEKLTNPKSRVNSKNSNRLINDTINNFSIETEYGFYIKSGDYESYTFEVFRENGSDFLLENVVVSKNTDNTYQTILYQYNITSDELEAYKNGEYVNFIGKTNKIVLENSSISSEIIGKYKIGAFCYEDVQQFVPGQNCTAGGNHAFGDTNCQGTGNNVATAGHYVTIAQQVTCDEEGGGGTPTPTPEPNDYYGYIPGQTIITSPTTMTPAQSKVKAFKMQLSSSQKSCFNSLPPNVQSELNGFVAHTLLPLEDGTTVTTENPVHTEAEAMMAQMCSNSGVFNSITPFLIEKKIDDTLLDPCSKGVYQQIKNASVCDFANIFAKLGADNSIYNTTLNTSHNNYLDSNGNLQEVPDPANTIRTTPNVKYNYTVYINPDYPGKTKLYIASLLLHEITHAYFFSLVDDFNMGANNSFNELPILYNAAVINHFPINPELHHEEIANSYVNAIKDALQEFQPGLYPQVYEDLAWSGLEKTSVFNTRHPVGSESRQRILNRKAAEQTGNTVGGGTPSEQSPFGQPCN